jgi:hypothetical protein
MRAALLGVSKSYRGKETMGVPRPWKLPSVANWDKDTEVKNGTTAYRDTILRNVQVIYKIQLGPHDK